MIYGFFPSKLKNDAGRISEASSVETTSAWFKLLSVNHPFTEEARTASVLTPQLTAEKRQGRKIQKVKRSKNHMKFISSSICS